MLNRAFVVLINKYLFQVKKEHRPLVQDLLPLLETLAEGHPSVEVQDMASDLRIAIATHGAVWSHKMDVAAKNLGKQTDAVKLDSGSTSVASGGTDSFVAFLCCLFPVSCRYLMLHVWP